MNDVPGTTNILENQAKYRKVMIDSLTCRHSTTPSLGQGESGQGLAKVVIHLRCTLKQVRVDVENATRYASRPGGRRRTAMFEGS